MNIKRRIRAIALSQLALCASLAVFANDARAEKVLAGEVCSIRVHNLAQELTWNKNLQEALDKAKAEQKLVVWIHMLGKIDGDT